MARSNGTLQDVLCGAELSRRCCISVEIPDRGGETSFCDTSLVYDARYRKRRRSCRRACTVSCSYDYEATRPEDRDLANFTSGRPNSRSSGLSPSGRKSIFPAPLMVERHRRTSAKRERCRPQGKFTRFSGDPRIHYEHVWQSEDTLIWDNRCCTHRRADFDPNQRRFMRRVSIADFSVNSGWAFSMTAPRS